MNVAVCFNRVPPRLVKGETADRISEEGAEAEAQSVRTALEELGHRPTLVPLGADVGAFIADLRAAGPEIVFNLCEGFWGESRKEMHVAALLDLLGYPFTGSPALTLGLTQDKVRTKDLLVRHQLPTPAYAVIPPGQPPEIAGLAYPLFVKPRFEDASLGISAESIVETRDQLQKRLDYLHATYRQDALVEEYIEGREINAAVIGDPPAEPLPLSEIRFRSGLPRPIVSYDGKWQEDSAEYAGTEPACPSPLETGETRHLQEVAVRACTLLGCRDYARVDIRLRGGIPYILEINANPDISPGAGLARAARVAGITYNALIDRILGMTVDRKEALHAKP